MQLTFSPTNTEQVRNSSAKKKTAPYKSWIQPAQASIERGLCLVEQKINLLNK